jgi:hypothetical protein
MKKYLLFTILCILILPNTALSQNVKILDTLNGWHRDGFIAINFNQMHLSNWAQGGEPSYSGSSFLNSRLFYKDSLIEWENYMELGYGVIKTEENPIRKTEDKIDINSKVGTKAYNKFFYTGLMNLKSQFTKGYNYPNDSVKISDFFAPAYLIASLGMDYKPTNSFSFYLSPATGRFIFVLDEDLANTGRFGVKPAVVDEEGNIITPGEKVKAEFGAYATLSTNLKLMENVHLRSKLDLFNDYTDENRNNRKNIDVNWETGLIMQVNKFITTNIFFHLIYDHNTPIPLYEKIDGVKTKVGEGPRTQIKQSLGIGFVLRF